METTLQQATTIEEKARELCQFVLDDAGFASAQGRIELFMESEEAKNVYRAWQEKSHELHAKNQQGMQPTEGDVAELESLKAAVLNNPVAVDFVEAENEMNAIFGSVTKLLQKTLQLGQIPTEEDMKEGECCGN
ncbi:MAG: YlbF family regulator, partial [Verrucomicrobiota bacterium]